MRFDGARPPAAVVLDYGRVLSRDQSAEARATIERLTGVAPEALWDAYWAERGDYDRGLLDGPAYWWRVGARLGRSWPDRVLAELTAADAESWSLVDPVMVAWAAELAEAGVRTALLSNAPPELRDLIRARFEWAERLDARVYSCEVGAVKPEPAIYRHCLAALGGDLEPGRVLLVDDRKVNVDGAVEVGWAGVVFTSAAALADELRDTGLPLPRSR